MRILAISGSLRRESSNSALLHAIAGLAGPETEFDFYEDLGELPHFSPEIDGEAIPPAVHALRARMAAADGVMICTPEYAHGMPGSLKNALDWAVPSGDFYRKPVSAISASPHPSGGEWAHDSLIEVLKTQGAEIVRDASLSVGFVRGKIGADGEIVDSELIQQVRTGLDSLTQAIRKAEPT